MSLCEEEFTEWFCRNYPKDTIIGRPEWHAPKIFRRANQRVEKPDAKEVAEALMYLKNTVGTHHVPVAVWETIEKACFGDDIRPVVTAWANRDDLTDVISDKKKQDMIKHFHLPGRILAEKYSIPLIQRD